MFIPSTSNRQLILDKYVFIRVHEIKGNTKHAAFSEEFQSLIENRRNNCKIDTSKGTTI